MTENIVPAEKNDKKIKNAPAGRNYGIDLLKLLAMFYVIILHTMGHGGILEAAAEGSAQFNIAWFMEVWAYPAVDIFALVTGYVTAPGRSVKKYFENWVSVWLQVVFISGVTSVVLKLVEPGLLTGKDVFKSFFPLINGRYWYFIAYSGAMILMPLIMTAVEHLSVKDLKKMFFAVFIGFSVINMFTGNWDLGNGYSFVWMAVLFFLGAALRKCGTGKEMRAGILIAGIPVFCIFVWLWKIYGFDHEFSLFNIEITGKMLFSYTSPLILGTAILYVMLFSRIKTGPAVEKIISFLAPGAFTAYLFNDHIYLRKLLITDRFSFLAGESTVSLILGVLLFSFVFLMASVIIDKIRQYLFRVLRINELKFLKNPSN